MDRVSDLGEVALSEVLGLDLSDDGTTELADLGRRIDGLRTLDEKPGWAVGMPPMPVLTDHPIPRDLLPKIPASVALATVLERPRDPGDVLEYAVEVWHDGEGSLLVTAAVEVGCFCEAEHQTHSAAESAWSADTEDELLSAFDEAADQIEQWAGEGASADEWRNRADLPAR